MGIIFATKVTTPVINWVAELLGFIMNLLFKFTSMFGIESIGLCIILFTLIVNLLMLPLTIKQQKSTRLNSVMQPEIQAIQKKYAGKKDQVSQQRMQAETQAVYEKYGTSMFGGCAQLLIQFPILIALYQVIYHIPGYVPQVRAILEPAAASIMSADLPSKIEALADAVKLPIAKYDYTDIKYVVDLLYKLSPKQWGVEALAEADKFVPLMNIFPEAKEVLGTAAAGISRMNSFLGLNLSAAPWQGFKLSWAWLIPALAGVTQWVSAKLMTAGNPQTAGNDSAAATMNSMNTIMPIMSVVFCFTLPAFIGIYWVASSLCRCIIQLPLNAWSKKIDVDELVKQNIEKQNKKRAKKGLPPVGVDKKAQAEAAREERIRKYEEEKKAVQKEKSDKQVIDSTQYYNLNARPGSLAAKANMVAMYEAREYEKRHGKKKDKTEDKEN